MSRMLAALANDIRLQVRYGLYAVSAVMVLVWGALLGTAARAVPLSTAMLLPPLVVLNLLITTFYFMAALVLFEKAEGVLSAIVVTPLSGTTYLLSKALSLTFLATAETLLIAAVHFDDVLWTRTIAASLLLGIIYAGAGFVAVARYNSINEFLLPSMLVVLALLLPLLAHLGVIPRWTMLLHPVDAPMRLIAKPSADAIALAVAWCAIAVAAARTPSSDSWGAHEPLRHPARTDLRNIRRDPLLAWVILLPLALAFLYRLTPLLRDALLARFGFDLQPYYPLIASSFITSAPGIAGMVIGFLLLDERDDGILLAVAVTPVEPRTSVAHRIAAPLLAGFLITIIA